VRVADIGREEFEEAHAGALARRQRRAPATRTTGSGRAGSSGYHFRSVGFARLTHLVLRPRRAYARAADEFLAWCASAGRAVDWRHAAGARRDLDQSRYARACGAERQAAARRDPSPVRLAGHRPGRAGQPGRVGTRAPARRDVRANPGPRHARCSTASTRRPSSVCAIAR
jgi:hypothetical protein